MKKVIIIVLVLIILFVSGIFLSLKNAKSYDFRNENMIINTKSGNKIETEYAYIDNNKFYFKVPTEFKELTYEKILNKYDNNYPNVVYSNDDLTINIAVNLTNSKMKNTQIENYANYIYKRLKDSNEIISNEIYKIQKYDVGKIEFISNANDTKIYNNMIFFSYNDKLVIITFNSILELKDEWESVGNFVLESLIFS